MDEHRKYGADGSGDALSGSLRARLLRFRLFRRSSLPPRLRHRLEASADAWIQGATHECSPPAIVLPANVDRPSRVGWYATAACLVVALLAALVALARAKPP